jgi:uncharacterized protein (DUF111 family)
VAPSTASSGSPIGCDLHLDVSLGCAGDMLVAALLDAGAPAAALKQGLTDAGLLGVGPLIAPHRAGGLSGTRVTFVDALGHALEGPSEDGGRADELRRPAARAVHKRAGPTPHRDHRRSPTAAEIVMEAGEEPEEEGARILAGPGAGAAEPAPPPGRIARWLEGHEATGGELIDLIKASHLEPITRALVLRALTPLIGALAATRGGTLEQQRFGGRQGLDMLCDVVGACALVRALDPGRITSSRVTVSTAPVVLDGMLQPGPLSWLLACLDGLPLDEQDLPHACTTPTGAALVATLARRAGPRRHVQERGRGVGFGALAPTGIANVCRVLLSDPPTLQAREGTEASGPLVALSATLLGAEARLPALLEALVQAGGHDLHTSAVHDEERGARTRVHALAERATEEDLRRLLYQHGAEVVVVGEVQRHATGVREVTVAVGSAKKRHTVRIRERIWAGELLSAEPDEADLQRAADRTALSVAALRGDALAAWRQARQSPADGQGEPSTDDTSTDPTSTDPNSDRS